MHLPKTAESPGRCCLLSPALLPGLPRWDISTIGRTSGVSLRLDLFTSPVSPCGGAGDALFRTRSGCPVPARRHRFTLTRLPVPSVLVPWNRPLRGQLGWPQILRLRTTAPSPAASCEPGCLATPPRLPGVTQQVPVADGYPSTRSDPTPSQLPAPDADSPLPAANREPGLRWPVDSVPVPNPLRLVDGVGRTEAPSSPPRSACALRNDDQ